MLFVFIFHTETHADIHKYMLTDLRENEIVTENQKHCVCPRIVWSLSQRTAVGQMGNSSAGHDEGAQGSCPPPRRLQG